MTNCIVIMNLQLGFLMSPIQIQIQIETTIMIVKFDE